MKLGTLITIAAVIAVAFGVPFVAAPALMLTQYGIVALPGTTILARFFGAALINIGLVLFAVRAVAEPTVRLGVARASLVGSLAGLLVAVHGQRTGAVNSLGWSTVAIYALLSAGYAYFALRARVESADSRGTL